jgi:transcriptional regulator with XRE-family HTH domain
MGAIGSLIYLIKYLLSQMLLRAEDGRAVLRPASWYLFRPVFGIVVAFAIYLLYKTGQIALGGGSANLLASDVNLPILSVVSLFAGLLSWQALELVESKGRKWLSAQRRENLWASGLAGALRRAGKTNTDCAAQVGVTPNQVDRWIAGQDKVTPEMQDRVTTWLNRDRDEIFGDVNPKDIDEGTLRWATGLKGALKANKAGIDVPRLAQMIGQDVATVHAWVELKRQVDQEMQFLIADKLGEPRDRLFTAERPDAESWAVGLRAALQKGSAGLHTADDLARAIGSTPQSIRRYMELKASVPKPVQALIVEALAVNYDALFSPDLPPDEQFKWAAKLRECLRKSPIQDSAALAAKIDTEAAWVRGWMEQEVCGGDDAPYCGQVAPETQRVLADAVGCAPDTLFRSERPAADFKWVVMPRFRELVEAPGRGGVGGLAGRLDLDVPRIERWMSHLEPVAPATQLALLNDFGLAVEELDALFTSRPPVDLERPDGVWWARGLRAAVREHPDYRTLADLAAQLDIPVRTLFDQVELLEPVPMDQRDRITRLLGPDSAQAGPLFSTQGPDWTEFCWAPGLRSALDTAAMDAADLATRLDIEVSRVRDWMEMDQNDAETRWASGKVKRGQIAPSTCEEIRRILGGALPADCFTKARQAEGVYAVKPTFRIAVDAFDGRLGGFAEQIDADPKRVERWLDQSETILPATKDRILDVLGLERAQEAQLFDTEPREESALG